jgi:hypothetical protein
LGFSEVGTAVVTAADSTGDPRSSWKEYTYCNLTNSDGALTWHTAVYADGASSSTTPAASMDATVVVLGSYKYANGGFGGVVASKWTFSVVAL